MLAELRKPSLAQITQKLGSLTFVRNATKRAAGSRTSMKDSAGRRLGMKRSDGQPVKAGEIIYRQRGTKFYPGENADIGKDHTIWAKEPGFVKFYYDPFHPKRRLIGVALKREYELPTPHFEPRRRRLGHVPITTKREANEEREWLSRKEELALPRILEEVRAREETRNKRAQEFLKQLSNFVQLSSQQELDLASERLVNISIYLAGGRNVVECRKLVDAAFIQDIKLDQENGRISPEEYEYKLTTYNELVSKLDAAVTFGPDRQLVKAFSDAELEAMRNDALAKIKQILENAESPLNKQVKSDILSVIEQPCFDLSARVRLRRQYLRSAPPLLIKNDEFEKFKKLVKDGKGQIVKSWNYELRRVDNIFLPKGTSKMAIH